MYNLRILHRNSNTIAFSRRRCHYQKQSGSSQTIAALSVQTKHCRPSECDDVIRRAHVSRSRGLPHPSVSSSRFLVAKGDFRLAVWLSCVSIFRGSGWFIARFTASASTAPSVGSTVEFSSTYWFKVSYTNSACSACCTIPPRSALNFLMIWITSAFPSVSNCRRPLKQRRHQYSARQHKTKVRKEGSRLLSRESTGGVPRPHQCSREQIIGC